ncbi:MAG: M3 family metallopeptidase [Zetaproteobacteria bacterium]|nr:M3 family metallopeptidase [Zetaproteobacteria bacterium]
MSMTPNPLLAEFHLAPFGSVSVSHIEEALQVALEQAEADFGALQDSSRDDWDGFVVPLMQLGENLGRIWQVPGHLMGLRNTDELRELVEKWTPKMTQFFLRLSQDQGVYTKLLKLQKSDAFTRLSRAAQRAVEKRIQAAKFAGVALDGVQKQQFLEIAEKLSQLSNTFSNHVLDATKQYRLVLKDKADIQGLSQHLLEIAAANYKREYPEEVGVSAEEGPWCITLDYAMVSPFLEECAVASIRESYHKAFCSRASTGEWDNLPLIREILELREQKAALLGFANYAELSTASKMAENPQRVEALMTQLTHASRAAAEAEFKELVDYAQGKGYQDTLQAWDVAFWRKKLKEARYGVSDEVLRPYFPLQQVLDGLFSLVYKLFAVQVVEVEADVASAWHPDVRCFQLRNEQQLLATFYLDPYVRPHEKRSGAWADDLAPLREQAKDGKTRPVALVVCNFARPLAGQPSLLTLNEVSTLFHEMGHALQHMLTQESVLDCCGLSGIEWDAVEIASQFMENFVYDKPTLMSFAKHYQTGEPLSEELFAQIIASKNFGAALGMLGQIRYATLDQRLHIQKMQGVDPLEVQREVAAQYSFVPAVEGDAFICSFGHIFAGGYAAGYYSYKWSEVYSADAFAAFEEVGLENTERVQQVGQKYKDTILACGGGENPLVVFKNFRGRDATVDALLRHSGLKG